MLNQDEDRSISSQSQWCVGEPPLRWDISFGARLAEKVRQLFGRDQGERPMPVRKSAIGERDEVRRAA